MRLLPVIVWLACVAVQFVSAVEARAETRLALVMGNGAYDAKIGALPNPVNDSRIMAASLEKVGFTVTLVTDADQKTMKRAIADFGDALMKAGNDTVGLFYFAGHGIQVGGLNYLVPVGAVLEREADVDLEAIDASTVLRQMEFAGARINVVILDACRNNPLARSVRSASRGLARMDAPTGSFVAYSTAPGDVASDGSGNNSPFAEALATEILQENLSIEEVFRRVRVQVKEATGDQQIPWDSSSLTDAFVFNQQAATETVATDDAETVYWKSVANSTDPAALELFLAKYPDGTYADLAKLKLANLQSAGAATTQVAARDATAGTNLYADKDYAGLAKEIRPLPQILRSLRESAVLQSVPAPDAFVADLTYIYNDNERSRTEQYESRIVADNMALVARNITYRTPWSGEPDKFEAKTNELATFIGPLNLGNVGEGTETSPDGTQPSYYAAKGATIDSSDGAMFPIGEGSWMEVVYSLGLQSGQSLPMKLAAQVTGQRSCTSVSNSLTGTCYVVEVTSTLIDQNATSFWTLVYADSLSAFVPWGEFGVGDVVEGNIEVSSLKRL